MTEQTNEAQKNLPGIAAETERRFPLLKINFVLMACAVAVIVTGFLLMLGEPSSATEFNPDIFSVRRTVVGPTIAFLGFIFMGFGIIYRPGKKEEK